MRKIEELPIWVIFQLTFLMYITDLLEIHFPFVAITLYLTIQIKMCCKFYQNSNLCVKGMSFKLKQKKSEKIVFQKLIENTLS